MKQYLFITLFLAGCFLAKGSINEPNVKHTHLEIRFKSEMLSDFVKHLLFKVGIKSLNFNRSNQSNVIIKNKKSIPDFLKLVFAIDAMYEFENARLSREMLSDIRRYDTIDEVNIRKRSILHEKFELKIETLNQEKHLIFKRKFKSVY